MAERPIWHFYSVGAKLMVLSSPEGGRKANHAGGNVARGSKLSNNAIMKTRAGAPARADIMCGSLNRPSAPRRVPRARNRKSKHGGGEEPRRAGSARKAGRHAVPIIARVIIMPINGKLAM